MVAAWNDLPPTGGLPECAALVELAERLRWSAPELVVLYARRALVEGGGAGGSATVRAQALLAGALVRLGRHAEAVEPALVALRAADQAGVPEFGLSVRLDLATCSRALGEPMLGCLILRPVLDAPGARPATRAGAIARLVGCTAHVARRDDLEDSLAEADRLFAADDGLSADVRRVERALLASTVAAYHRRYGETEDAVESARDGLGQLARLRDTRLEGGQAMARLVLELVCALLDDGQLTEAEHEAAPVLGAPVRAASAPAVGRLVLAIATRVQLPGGRVESGRGLLDHVTWIGERHGLDWLLADALTARADLDERAAKPGDALTALRSAHAAEHRHRRSVGMAKRRLMAEFGVPELSQDAVNSVLRGMIRAPVAIAPLAGPADAAASPAGSAPAAPVQRSEQPESAAPETDAATGLLTREGLSRRLAAVRRGDRPVSLTLVRLGPVDAGGAEAVNGAAPARAAEPSDPPPDALATLAGRVRDIVPEDAELARPAGSELAVLLPHTTREAAEELAATIRESAIESDWLTGASGQEVSISTGVAESGPGAATDEDADSLLTAARETLVAAGRDRTDPSPPGEPAPAEESFLSTLDMATGGQPDEPRQVLDEGGDRPDPNDRARAIRDLLAPLLDHPTLLGPRTTTPRIPDPDDVPEPPSRPDIPIPAEPDQIPPIPPLPGPIPEVPPPSESPATSEPGPAASPEPEPGETPDVEPRQSAAPEPGRDPDEADSDWPWRLLSDDAPATVAEPDYSPTPVTPAAELDRDPPDASDPGLPWRLLSAGGDSAPGRTLADDGAAPPAEPAAETTAAPEPERPWDGLPENGRTPAAAPPAETPPEQDRRLADFVRLWHALGDDAAPPRDERTDPQPEPEQPEPQPTAPARLWPPPGDDTPPLGEDTPPPGSGLDADTKPAIRVSPERWPDAEDEASATGPHRVDDPLEVILGPAEDSRPPDRVTRRRDRSDTTSIADLLTEALVAYQETGPDEPVLDDPEPVAENTPPAQRATSAGHGRHRLPDWGNV